MRVWQRERALLFRITRPEDRDDFAYDLHAHPTFLSALVIYHTTCDRMVKTNTKIWLDCHQGRRCGSLIATTSATLIKNEPIGRLNLVKFLRNLLVLLIKIQTAVFRWLIFIEESFVSLIWAGPNWWNTGVLPLRHFVWLGNITFGNCVISMAASSQVHDVENKLTA